MAIIKHTALNHAQAGVRCNVIGPGPIDIEVRRESQHGTDSSELKRVSSGMQNLPQIGEPAFNTAAAYRNL